jgi:hypothetical protein
MLSEWEKPNWRLQHPVQRFWIMVALMSATSAAVSWMAPQPDHWLGLAKGIAYSLFLGFVSIGLCLLPFRLRRRAIYGSVVGLVCGPISCLLVALLAWKMQLKTLEILVRPLFWLVCVVIATGFGMAAYGWWCHWQSPSAPTLES